MLGKIPALLLARSWPGAQRRLLLAAASCCPSTSATAGHRAGPSSGRRRVRHRGCRRGLGADSRRRSDRRAKGEVDGPYLLDAGDRLRIFVYGHPNLSRLYTVDQQGMVSVPLIGDVPARGRTTQSLAQAIAARLRRAVRARSAGHGRRRPEPAVLHPGRGAQCRPVSLRERHDGEGGSGDRRRTLPTAPTSAASRSPAVASTASSRRWMFHRTTLSSPATRSTSTSAGSERARRQGSCARSAIASCIACARRSAASSAMCAI